MSGIALRMIGAVANRLFGDDGMKCEFEISSISPDLVMTLAVPLPSVDGGEAVLTVKIFTRLVASKPSGKNLMSLRMVISAQVSTCSVYQSSEPSSIDEDVLVISM